MMLWRFTGLEANYRWTLRSWGVSSSILAEVERVRGDEAWQEHMRGESIKISW
jgi:hypothetical protein